MRSTPTWSAYTASKTDASSSSGSSVATGVDASAAVAIDAAVHADMPATKTQTRAVPRSRIVARIALYSSCARSVIVFRAWGDNLQAPAADNQGNGLSVSKRALW